MINKIHQNDSSRCISEKEFFALNMKDVYIIDVRHAFETTSGCLENAHNIPFIDIGTKELPKDKIILTYCNYGNRAGQAALQLYNKGYNAYNLGGYALFSKKLIDRCRK
ncbi:MAG: rhodanese-like domain-containing protein [Brevinemataceae bacterium]